MDSVSRDVLYVPVAVVNRMLLIDFLELSILLRLLHNVFELGLQVPLDFGKLPLPGVLEVLHKPHVSYDRGRRLRVSLELT